jgi:hypothetical protein
MKIVQLKKAALVVALGIGFTLSSTAQAYSCGLMEDRCNGGMQWFCDMYERAVLFGDC